MTSVPRLAAAVLVPIRSEPPHNVLFIRRAAHLRRHAGQIGFPGGRLDDADGGDLARTAVREAHEEIGLDPQRVTIVAQLQGFSQRAGQFDITPFVGIVAPGAALQPDGGEVAAIHEVPLRALLADGAVHRGVEAVGELRVETWLFDDGDVHVWGATGHILARFIDTLNGAQSPLAGALHAHGITTIP